MSEANLAWPTGLEPATSGVTGFLFNPNLSDSNAVKWFITDDIAVGGGPNVDACFLIAGPPILTTYNFTRPTRRPQSVRAARAR